MAVNRSYLADSGSVALSGTSLIPYLYFATTATSDANIGKIKLMVPGSASAAPASNADVIGILYKVTGTVGNNTAITPSQLAGNALAANTVIDTAASSAGLSGLTSTGQPLWIGDIPETSGAGWADDHENTGFEVGLLPSTKYALYAQAAAGAGSNMNVRFGVWFFE
jgi:hypothetical protein